MGMAGPPVERAVEVAADAERRGFDAFWLPDHLMGWCPDSLWVPDVMPLAERCPSPHALCDPFVLLGAVAGRTTTIGVGTAVTDPVRRHPAVLAQAFLTVDHLSRGRAICGLGAGERENLEPYGLPHDRPAARFAEAVEVIRALWAADGPVSYDGDHWKLDRAVVGLGPYHARRYPPLWAGAHGPRMLDTVGRLCDGWLPTYQGQARWIAGWARVQEAAARYGRTGALTGGVVATVVLGPDHATAHHLLQSPAVRSYALGLPAAVFEDHRASHPLGDGAYGLRDFIPNRWEHAEALAAVTGVSETVVHATTLHGTPDDVAQKLLDLRAAGLRHVVLVNLVPAAAPERTAESRRLLDDLLRRVHRSGP